MKRVATVALGLTLALAWVHAPRHDEPTPAPSTAVATAPSGTDRAAPARGQPLSAAAPPSTTAATASRRDLVDRLAASGSPNDAMAAFMWIEACRLQVDFDREFDLVKLAERTADLVFRKRYFDAHREQACGDLAEKDIAPARRIALLEKAAKAGVPMAAIYLVREGPAGDPDAWATRPQDPMVLEFNRRATELIQLAAAKGDEVAMFSLAEQYSTGVGVASEHNPELAYAWAVAWLSVRAARKSEPVNTVLLNQYADGLSPDEITRATQAGERLAAQALKKE